MTESAQSAESNQSAQSDQSDQPAESNQPTDYHHWQYFLALENDLINVSRYIEFIGADDQDSPDTNAKTYSLELARILLMACAECEIILKIIARKSSPNPDKRDERDISPLCSALTKDYTETYDSLINTTILVPVYDLKFQPWKQWNKDNPPKWWSDHNKVKHHRISSQQGQEEDKYYKQATLYNALSSVAALMCLLFHFYDKKHEETNKSLGLEVSFPYVLAPRLFSSKKPAIIPGDNLTWVWGER